MKRKYITTLLIITFFILVSFFSMNFNKQSKIIGKTYIANLGETCKDGIGTLHKYRVLQFDKDSVIISHKITAHVNSSELKILYEHMFDNLTEKHKWEISKGKIIIQKFYEFNNLEIKEKKIITEKIEFTEQRK